MADGPNQPALGRLLRDVPRDSYFLTTKIDPSYSDAPAYATLATNFTPATAYYRTIEQAAHNLADLEVERVDLLLVHWSSPDCAVMRETWRAMEQVHALGWASAIGVSNYCPSTLACILETARVVPAVNQVKFHAGNGADPGGVKSFCDARGIVLQAYSPLGAGTTDHPRTPELITGDLVTRIGEKYGVSGAQVSLRWVVQNGVPVAAESTNEEHLAIDLDIFGFELSDVDMATLNAATAPPSAFGGSYSNKRCNL